MLDYTLLDALSAVMRTGSFDAASAQLNITQSAVSQRIRLLEEKIGSVLIRRGQPCTATEMGAKLAAHADQVRLMEKALDDDLDLDAAAGATPLRIAVNADSLATWLLPALAATPGFLYDLVIDDQDHSADLLRSGEVSAAVTGHKAAVQGCDSHPLGALRYFATASPEFLARHLPDGPTAQGLAKAPALTFDRKDRLQADWARQVTGQRITLRTHHLASSQGFIEAAGLGMGWGMNPEPLLREAFKSSRLVPIAPDMPLDTPLYWQVSRRVAAPLKALTRAVKAAASEHLI